jgi:protocatechuate 3,4-dioxygenase beta subunit
VEVGKIRGIVTDFDGNPLKASVRALCPGSGWTASLQTDGSGTFTTECTDAAAYEFQVAAPGYVPMNGKFSNIFTGVGVDLRFRLFREVAVHGTVTDVDGNPVQGAIVTGVEPVVTDAEGKFTAHPFTGRPLTIQHESYATTEAALLPDNSAVDNVSVVMKPGGALRVAVTRGGKPVPMATVNIISGEEATQAVALPSQKTDPQGFASFKCLPVTTSGYAVIATTAEGDAGYLATPVRVQPNTEQQCTVTLPAQYPGKVRGRVLDEDGNPYKAAQVFIQKSTLPEARRTIKVGPDGSFEAGLEAGEQLVNADSGFGFVDWEGGPTRTVNVANTTQFEVEFRAVPPKNPKTPRVIFTGATGEPLERVLLQVINVTQCANGNVQCTIFAPGGSCGVRRNLLNPGYEEAGFPGALVFDVEGKSYGRFAWDETRQAVVANVNKPAAYLAGRVVDDAGNPLPGVIIVVGQRIPATVNIQIQSGADGRLSFGPFATEQPISLFQPMLPGYSPQADSVSLDVAGSDPAASAKVVMTRQLAELTGRVTYPDQTPVPGASVEVFIDAQSAVAFTKADASGQFKITLPPGRFQVHARASAQVSQPVVIEPPFHPVELVIPDDGAPRPADVDINDDAHQNRRNLLLQMGLVFKMYAMEHKGLFPTLEKQYGLLCPLINSIYPEYLSDTSFLLALRGQKDVKLCYFSYIVDDEAAALAFLDSYEQYGPEALAGRDLNAADGSRILMLTEKNATAVEQQQVTPVMWELSPSEPGGWVLYMDGHADWRQTGEFPLTKTVSERILAIANPR